MKQGHLENAIENFNLSVKNSVSDPRQKGVSFISLGEIYYDTLKDYSKAEAFCPQKIQIGKVMKEAHEALS